MLKYFFALILFTCNFIYSGQEGDQKPSGIDFNKINNEPFDVQYRIEKKLACNKSFWDHIRGSFFDRYLVVDKKYEKGIIAGMTPMSDEYVFNFKYKRDAVYLSGLLTYIAYKKGYLDRIKNKCKALHEKLIKSNKNNKK